MTTYGRTPWIDAFPRSRVPAYPACRGAGEYDAVIIGGGLTGCATAYAFAASGVKVALLEADRIGRGATAFSTDWIDPDPGVRFTDVERAAGVRAARRAFEAWRRAALDFAALLRRLDIRCHLEPRETLLVAHTPEQAAHLQRELKARRAAGLDGSALPRRAVRAATGTDAVAALRVRHGATVDPYRAALGLAAAAAARGAVLFERSAATKITFNRKIADVRTAAGTIRTRRVIVATGIPTPLFKPLVRHFWMRESFTAVTEPLGAKLRRQLAPETIVLRDAADPPHVVRWLGDRLLIAGADAPLGADRLREKYVIQRTGQLMYELSLLFPDISGVPPAYGWGAPFARSEDGLPHIGMHRNYPHHLFAFADASRGLAGAYLASRVLLRAHLDEPDPADDVFAFAR